MIKFAVWHMRTAMISDLIASAWANANRCASLNSFSSLAPPLSLWAWDRIVENRWQSVVNKCPVDIHFHVLYQINLITNGCWQYKIKIVHHKQSSHFPRIMKFVSIKSKDDFQRNSSAIFRWSVELFFEGGHMYGDFLRRSCRPGVGGCN